MDRNSMFKVGVKNISNEPESRQRSDSLDANTIKTEFKSTHNPYLITGKHSVFDTQRVNSPAPLGLNQLKLEKPYLSVRKKEEIQVISHVSPPVEAFTTAKHSVESHSLPQ
jgi:hypothetical protein